MEVYRLITQAEYAKKCGKSRAIINYYVKRGYLKTDTISGVKYIKVPFDRVDELDDPKATESEKLRIAWIK